MSRPTYETAENRGKEAEFADRLSKVSGKQFRKLPKAYRADYGVLDAAGYLTAFAELKCRTNDARRYGTYILSLHKWLSLLSLATAAPGLKSLLCVRFTDCDMVYRVQDGDDVAIKWGGRADRGDWQDQEPVVHIPMGSERWSVL